MKAPDDVKAIGELVSKESEFTDKITDEIGKVIVGQGYMVERIIITLHPTQVSSPKLYGGRFHRDASN